MRGNRGVGSTTVTTEAGLPPVLAIAGPTATGKSAFALALVERLEGLAEIISVDSAQIYRGMDIGSAKPDAATRAQVPHHLLDILDPVAAYSAARFAEDARAAIVAIRARGRVPILVGGTMLYFRALFGGLSVLPRSDPAVRAELAAEAARDGGESQHARLAMLDAETAARLHPNDAQRVQRALEIHTLSGEPASRWYARPKAGHGIDGRIVRFALQPPERASLDLHIAVRFRRMLDDGFVDEVAGLHARGDLHLGLPSMRAVGYRQIWRHLDGDCGLAEAEKLAIIATRQYAKRQMTWLRGDASWRWLDATEPLASARVLNEIAAAPTSR